MLPYLDIIVRVTDKLNGVTILDSNLHTYHLHTKLHSTALDTYMYVEYSINCTLSMITSVRVSRSHILTAPSSEHDRKRESIGWRFMAIYVWDNSLYLQQMQLATYIHVCTCNSFDMSREMMNYSMKECVQYLYKTMVAWFKISLCRASGQW